MPHASEVRADDRQMTVKLRSLQHVGMTVMNLERSLRFYQGAFAMVPVERTSVGGTATASAAASVTNSGPSVTSNAVSVTSAKLAFFQVGDCLVELLEVAHPKGRELR